MWLEPREVLVQQLIHLIFCKIYDEKLTSPENIFQFRVGIGESPKAVQIRILELFQKVQQNQKDVFEDQIILDKNSIAIDTTFTNIGDRWKEWLKPLFFLKLPL